MVCYRADTARKWYQAEIRCWTRSSHSSLLILRLYFGWGFIWAGLGKLLNVETHDSLLPGLGHPIADAQCVHGGDHRDGLRLAC